MLKNIIRSLFAFLILFVTLQQVDARKIFNPISSAINDANISRTAMISVSFKDIKTSKTYFEMNENKPMIPASVQKLVTFLPSINTLGKNYEFKTQLYKDKNGNLYLKLGADPYLTSRDLKGLMGILSDKKITKTKQFFIDDSILDEFEWGEGWQWDDDLNPLMPKFSSYNLDGNIFKATFIPTIPDAPVEIVQSVFYPTSFINRVLTGSGDYITLQRKNYISPDVIDVDGVISKEKEVLIPINHPRRYFVLRLEEILRKQKFGYYGDFKRTKLPKDAILLGEIKHSVNLASSDILKKSNNMIAETLFKLAGGKFSQSTGTIEGSIDMFNKYYEEKGINVENVRVVDGSGVSKNNLLTTDFVTNVLLNQASSSDFDYLKSNLATPNEGTLTDRMLYFKDKLYAKTGTLSNVSAIAGYLTAKSGKIYAFCIMINDAKSKSTDLKSFEEYVLRRAYEKL